MVGKKIFRILSGMDAWDLWRLEQFLNSPYFNKHSVPVALFSEIRLFLQESEPTLDFKKNLNSNLCAEKKIYIRVFPGESFDNQKWRLALSQLTGLIEEFFVIEELRKGQGERQFLLLSALKNRGLPEDFDREIRKIDGKTVNPGLREKIPEFGAILLDFRQQEIAFVYESERANRSQNQRLSSLTNSLDLFNSLAKLRYGAEALNRGQIVGGEEEGRQFLEWVEALERGQDASQNTNRDSKLSSHRTWVRLWLDVVKMQQNPSEESVYFNLLELLEENSTVLPLSESATLYGYALNYCIRKLNEGKQAWLSHLFDLYKKLLQFRILLQGDFLPASHLKNIVTVAIRLNAFEWTADFLRDYLPMVEENERVNAAYYNRARLAYAQKQPEKAKKLLLEVEFTDLFYALDSRSLLLKCFFELGEFEPLFSHLVAFRSFIKRQKNLSEVQKRTYLNFLLILGKLSHFASGSRIKFRDIQNLAENKQPLGDKQWLLTQIALFNE